MLTLPELLEILKEASNLYEEGSAITKVGNNIVSGIADYTTMDFDKQIYPFILLQKGSDLPAVKTFSGFVPANKEFFVSCFSIDYGELDELCDQVVKVLQYGFREKDGYPDTLKKGLRELSSGVVSVVEGRDDLGLADESPYMTRQLVMEVMG